MKGLKIDRDDMVDTDGVEYENYSATFKGKEVVVRVPIDRHTDELSDEVSVKRYWADAKIQEQYKSYTVGIALWNEHEIWATSEKEALEIAEHISDTGTGCIVNRTCEIWGSPDKEEVA